MMNLQLHMHLLVEHSGLRRVAREYEHGRECETVKGPGEGMMVQHDGGRLIVIANCEKMLHSVWH